MPKPPAPVVESVAVPEQQPAMRWIGLAGIAGALREWLFGPRPAPAQEVPVASLALGPNDILVVSTPHALSKDQAEAIGRQLSEGLDKAKVMVLPADFRLSVVKRPAA